MHEQGVDFFLCCTGQDYRGSMQTLNLPCTLEENELQQKYGILLLERGKEVGTSLP